MEERQQGSSEHYFYKFHLHLLMIPSATTSHVSLLVAGKRGVEWPEWKVRVTSGRNWRGRPFLWWLWPFSMHISLPAPQGNTRGPGLLFEGITFKRFGFKKKKMKNKTMLEVWLWISKIKKKVQWRVPCPVKPTYCVWRTHLQLSKCRV